MGNLESSEEPDRTTSGNKLQADEKDAFQGNPKIIKKKEEIPSENKSEASMRDANLEIGNAELPKGGSVAAPSGSSASSKVIAGIPSEITPEGRKRESDGLDSYQTDVSQERIGYPSQGQSDNTKETEDVPSVNKPEASARDAHLKMDKAELFQDKTLRVPQENSVSSEAIGDKPSGSKPDASPIDANLESDVEDASQGRFVVSSRGKSKSTEETDEVKPVDKPYASIADGNPDSEDTDGHQDGSFAVGQRDSVSCKETDTTLSGNDPDASMKDTSLRFDEDAGAQDRSLSQSQGTSESAVEKDDIPQVTEPNESTSDSNLDSNEENTSQVISKVTDEIPSGNKPDSSTLDTKPDFDQENGTRDEGLATDEIPSESKRQTSMRDTSEVSNKAGDSQDMSLVPSQGKPQGSEDTDETPSVNKASASTRDTDPGSDSAAGCQITSLALPRGDSESSTETVCNSLGKTSDTNIDSDEEVGTQASFASEPHENSEGTGCTTKKVNHQSCCSRQWGLHLMLAMVLISGGAIGIIFGIINRTAPAIDWQTLGPEIYGDGALDSFGGTVALSADGTILAAGGMGLDKKDAGHVSVFSYDPIRSSWDLLGQEMTGSTQGDWFGDSLSLSSNGTIVAAGAPYHDKNGVASGQVRVHEYDPVANLWSPLGQTLYGEASYEFFGSSVALSADGTVLAISAPTSDGAARDAGRVYVYTLDISLNLWVLLGQQLNGVNVSDGFGEFLALSSNGKVLVVSAPYHDDSGKGTYRGHVQVYEYDTSSNRWYQLGQNLDGEEDYGRFGRSVAISADGLTVAAASSWTHYDPLHPGRVRVYAFDRISNLWSPVGQELFGEAAGDVFGESMALSSDGTILAVGAKGNDDNGKCSGNIRLFKYETNADRWNYMGQALEGKAANDFFGQAVDLSADGSVVAVGAASNNGNGQDSGLVRVFTSQ